MVHFFRRSRPSALWLTDASAREPQLSAAIAVPFFVGILLGCVVGLFSDSFPPAFLPLPSFFVETADSSGVWTALFHSARYIFLAAVCASSLSGVVLLPALAFLRGFFFSGAVSALFAARRYAGLLGAALCIGLPALAGLTAFLLAACGGLRLSLHLLSSLSPEPRRAASRIFRLRHLLLILALIALEALYIQYLLPHLILT